ncbi:M24 family metallopeptidase [Cohnella fermenti]|uniref:Aminopeptidase P family protein n=1 Tax=Cohnella fermenti TaxID=2565925 RepID=A0A4S4C7P7_9BACL|nr:Xaa-Pro peptidase family protein [Cohnella fermenti]THF83664.1 aminopeptidase P family protein [Cohnella fermenti]
MSEIYRLRRQRVIHHLKENGIEAALVTSPSMVYYATGFRSDPHERFLALLLDARSDEETLFAPELDAGAAGEMSTVAAIVPIGDTENPYEKLKARLGPSVSGLAIEKNHVTVDKAERLQAAMAGVRLHNLTPLLEGMRMRKTREEIEKVRLAVETVEKVMNHALTHAVVGMTELELTGELEFQMKRLGAEKPSFETIVLTGRRSALPHGVPGDAKLAENDFLLIDMGVVQQGYCSDITRTFIMGEGTAEQEAIYEAVRAANLRGIGAAKAGRPLSAVDKAARDEIVSRGYGPYFTHRVGHGFGMDIHEYPSLHGSNPDPIQPGLLFTVEPGIYVPEIGGVRIEDDLYIREDGTAEVITSFTKHLIRLG